MIYLIMNKMSINKTKKQKVSTIAVHFLIPISEEEPEKIQTYKTNLNTECTLIKVFKIFISSNSRILPNYIKFKKNFYFYLLRKDGAETPLSEDIKIGKLELKNDDKILISYKDKKHFVKKKEKEKFDKTQIGFENHLTSKETLPNFDNKIDEKKEAVSFDISEKNDEIIYKEKELEYHSELGQQKEKQNLKKLILCIVCILLILLSCLLLIFFSIKKKDEKSILIPNKIKKEEDLVIIKNYPKNMLLRFTSNKTTEINIDGKNETIDKENSQAPTTQTSDFFL